MDTTVRTPNSFLASNDPTPRAGSYPAWMIKAMEEYAQQKVDLSRKRIEELEKQNAGLASENTRRCNKINTIVADLYDERKRIEELEAGLTEIKDILSEPRSLLGDKVYDVAEKLLNHEHTR